MHRIISAAGATVLVVAALLAVGRSVDALEQERIVLGEDEVVVVEHGPLLGANQGAVVAANTTITTDICAAATFCDVIPLTVAPPRSFSMDDADVFVRVTLSWSTLVVPNVPTVGDAAVNDLDLWVVNDPFEPTAGRQKNGFTYYSSTAGMPEVVTMSNPIGDWNLLVNNATSTSLDYQLEVAWSTSRFPTVFESLPPTFFGDPGGGAGDQREPLGAPAGGRRAGAPVAPAGPTVPDLRLDTPAAPDPAFGDRAARRPSPAGPVMVSEEVATPTPVSADRPAPPSSAVVALWMVTVPLLLGGLGALAVRRRRLWT